MTTFLRTLRRSRTLACLLAAISAAGLAGCGAGFDHSAPASASAEIKGILHGGPNPVVGATVTLYATQSNGYGGAGKVLATAISSGTGSFSFNASSYTCPAGQQAYITSAGGNTGANTVNNNSLLMAALGSCSSLNASTSIWIDELTTVAAAYSLSNFITISGTGATAVVGVSAPANNNATTGSCTGTGTAMTCQAAGLAHAFLNAANLVSAVGTSSAPPTGLAYATPASNPTSASTAVALQNIVPQQIIDTLGNVVQACVNSTGGAAGSSTACGTLFTNSTPSTTYAASPITPTNTLQALVNLAKFPFMNPAAIYGIAQTSGFYQPTLTAAPADWTMYIIFRSLSAGTVPLGAVYLDTTDINDDIYTVGETVASTGSSTGGAPLFVEALSSNGSATWAAPAQITSNSTYLCLPNASGQASYSTPCGAATDTAGNLWITNGALAYSGGGLYQVKTSNGTVTQFNTTSGTTYYPYTVAVDANNDVFYTTANTGTNNLWKLAAGATSTTAPTAVTTGGAAYAGGHLSDALVFDAAGDLFGPLASGSNDGFVFAANTGTLSAEAFGTTANQCNCLGTGVDTYPTGAMVDSAGNFWFGNATNLIRILGIDAQTVTGGGSVGITTVAMTNSSQLRIPTMDGAGTIFAPDSGTSTPVMYLYYTSLATPAQTTLTGCNTAGATGNTACVATGYGAPNGGIFYKSVNASIDSTGSAWLSSYGNDGVIQIIGTAAPTWPQASYLHPGVMPH